MLNVGNCSNEDAGTFVIERCVSPRTRRAAIGVKCLGNIYSISSCCNSAVLSHCIQLSEILCDFQECFCYRNNCHSSISDPLSLTVSATGVKVRGRLM